MIVVPIFKSELVHCLCAFRRRVGYELYLSILVYHWKAQYSSIKIVSVQFCFDLAKKIRKFYRQSIKSYVHLGRNRKLFCRDLLCIVSETPCRVVGRRANLRTALTRNTFSRFVVSQRPRSSRQELHIHYSSFH